MLKNERVPTLVTLEAIAPALDVDLVDLVSGTDAESRLSDPAGSVRRTDYDEILERNGELENVIRKQAAELVEERSARGLSDARHDDLEASRDRLKRDLVDAQSKLAGAESRAAELQTDLTRYQDALHRALGQFSRLKIRIEELQRELGETKKSGKVGAILSGVAALAGVATLGFFMKDNADRREGPKKNPTPAK